MHNRTSKRDRLLRKALGRRYTFDASQGDLEVLRSLSVGTRGASKPGDPSFHAYAAAMNVANEFASQALDVLELIPFNNQLADLQEEYMPSYPPMSPITSAFFAGWMVLDAQDSVTGLTLAETFVRYLEHVGDRDFLRTAMAAMSDSWCSFYEVTEVESHGLKLWDIAAKQEFQCWNSSGYSGRNGEIWYVRLLPPIVNDANRWVTVSTPYVFRESCRGTWEAFFQRHAASGSGVGLPLRDYLKYGKSLGYWLEFLFRAMVGYTGNMVAVTGVPDDPGSLPHSHPKHRL